MPVTKPKPRDSNSKRITQSLRIKRAFHFDRITSKMQKLPSLPRDAWEWRTVGKLLGGLALIPWNTWI